MPVTREDSDPAAARAGARAGIRLTRRRLLAGGVTAAVSGGVTAAVSQPARADSHAPAAAADGGRRPDGFKGVLRVSTVGVEWSAAIRDQAQRDLGFALELVLLTSVEQVARVLAAPDSFDVLSGSVYQAARVWASRHLRPVDTRRIEAWPDLYPLFAWGKLVPGSKRCRYGVGDAPFRTLFLRAGTHGLPPSSARPPGTRDIVQWIDERTDRPYGGRPMPRHVVGVPVHFAAESICYRLDVIPKLPSRVSWAELLNRRWRSRVALQADPATALVDAGTAARALGLMRIENVGSMTRPEIDRLVKILTTYRRQGQFRTVWSSFNDSVNLIASKDVALAPVWPAAAARLAAEGIHVRYAVPPEGYRGTCSAIGISASVRDRATLDACYRLLNWMYGGFFGAAMMRQGYYVANGERLPEWIASYGALFPLNGQELRLAEYAYWYRGGRAARGLPDATGGTGGIPRGSLREGGSLRARMCRCSAWSTYFPAADYQVKRFDDFLST